MQRADSFIESIEHALGATQANLPSSLSLWECLNEAGRAIITEYQWSWRTRSATLEAVADQNWIALPDDFGRFLSIRTTGQSAGVKFVTLQEIADLRADDQPTDGFVQYVAVGATRPARGEEQPYLRLELHGTPTEDGTPSFDIFYAVQWYELSSSRPGDLPKLPDAFAAALRYKARAIAWNYQHQEPSSDDARYMAEIERLKKDDQLIVTDHGCIEGGASAFGDEKRLSPTFEIVFNP